ncbi:hypothetical protein [Citricoccus sp.]|uniref:hypothetical protein n=1 Tax=Citricoccus sp. TaxID=1978372 RepID=UPI0028BEC61F|nr:hypothetical protein [Citricoccus sp.]
MATTVRWLVPCLMALGVVLLPGFASPPVAAGHLVETGRSAVSDEVEPDTATARVRQLMAPWCTDVPTSVYEGSGGQAGYTEVRHPLFGRSGDPDVYITIGLQWPTDHAGTQAVALHECAHILQYRAYDYDAAALDADMARLYPEGTSSGTEHMADCMADAMGAVRSGSVDGRGYNVGYGGGCTPEQYDAATRLIDGHRP